jgi:predicted ATP-dependent serine protease
MKTLYRSVGKADMGGEPLPPVFQTFADNNIAFRRGEVSMIAGVPGAGKSTLALALALRMMKPTLYICADTNAHTMAMRIYSMLTGTSQKQAESSLAQNPDEAKKKLMQTNHIFWSFDSNPSLDDIDEEVLAFEELTGEPPQVIIVDNLTDMTGGGVESFGAMQEVLQSLKQFARENNAAVVILHHTKESYNGDPCQPMSAVQGMVNQTPAMILTVGQTANGMLGVAAVKNRYGRADSSGATPVWLQFNPEYMYIADVIRGDRNA